MRLALPNMPQIAICQQGGERVGYRLQQTGRSAVLPTFDPDKACPGGIPRKRPSRPAIVQYPVHQTRITRLPLPSGVDQLPCPFPQLPGQCRQAGGRRIGQCVQGPRRLQPGDNALIIGEAVMALLARAKNAIDKIQRQIVGNEMGGKLLRCAHRAVLM